MIILLFDAGASLMKHQWFLALAAFLAFVDLTGSARADLAAGIAAYEGKDFAAARRELLPLAEAGDAEAQWRLGRMFELGLGVPQDLREAASWYRRAAEKNQPDAAFHLGALYHHSSLGGGDADAVPWYRIAAEAGHLFAQLELAHIYDSTQGYGRPFVPTDKAEAQRWLDRAVPTLEACAGEGDPKCQLELAILYNDGLGVPKDMREAVRLYHLAAEGNEPRAQFMLGFFYAPRPAVFYQYVGSHHPGLDILTPNAIESYFWYALSARQNYRGAVISLPDVVKRMTPEELAEAGRRVDAWRPRE